MNRYPYLCSRNEQRYGKFHKIVPYKNWTSAVIFTWQLNQCFIGFFFSTIFKIILRSKCKRDFLKSVLRIFFNSEQKKTTTMLLNFCSFFIDYNIIRIILISKKLKHLYVFFPKHYSYGKTRLGPPKKWLLKTISNVWKCFNHFFNKKKCYLQNFKKRSCFVKLKNILKTISHGLNHINNTFKSIVRVQNSNIPRSGFNLSDPRYGYRFLWTFWCPTMRARRKIANNYDKKIITNWENISVSYKDRCILTYPWED